MRKKIGAMLLNGVLLGFVPNGVSYAIADYTAAELQALKPGLCTLDEALGVLAETGLSVQVEMKSGADGKACVEAVRRSGMEDRVVYISFYNECLEEVRASDPTA